MDHSQQDRIEVLLERVVGRDERLDDWRELREVARRSPEVWGAMADRLESDAELRLCLEQRAAAHDELVDPVALPFAEEAARPKRSGAPVLGWVAAVLVAALWLVDRAWLDGVGGGAPGRPSAPSESAQSVKAPVVEPRSNGEVPLQARAAGDDGRLDRRVLETLPNVLIRSVRRSDGRVEVVYLKRQVEQRFVEDVETLHADDGGAPFARPATPAMLVGGRRDH